jgi:hypothetical protein
MACEKGASAALAFASRCASAKFAIKPDLLNEMMAFVAK